MALALRVARDAHESIQQKRKWTGLPYYLHAWNVALLVSTVIRDDDDDGQGEEIVAAAALHDVLEDVPGWHLENIRESFGGGVASLVDEMTHAFTAEAYPELSRRDRKRLEAQRIAGTSHAARLIKTADNLDNIRDVHACDPAFALMYAQELNAYALALPDTPLRAELLGHIYRNLDGPQPEARAQTAHGTEPTDNQPR